MKNVLSSRKEVSHRSYEVIYLNGHRAFQKRMKVHLNLTSKFLEIPEFNAKIPYEKITDVYHVKGDKISTMNLLLTGLLGFLAFPLTKKFYMVLVYTDETGVEQKPVFDTDKIVEIETDILKRIADSSKDSF